MIPFTKLQITSLFSLDRIIIFNFYLKPIDAKVNWLQCLCSMNSPFYHSKRIEEMLELTVIMWPGKLYALDCGPYSRSAPFKHCCMEVDYSSTLPAVSKWRYCTKYFRFLSTILETARQRYLRLHSCWHDNQCPRQRWTYTSCLYLIGKLMPTVCLKSLWFVVPDFIYINLESYARRTGVYRSSQREFWVYLVCRWLLVLIVESGNYCLFFSRNLGEEFGWSCYLGRLYIGFEME